MDETLFSVKTNAALAELAGVAERRIYKWRKEEGGPKGLDLRAWCDWLGKVGKATSANRLHARIVAIKADAGRGGAPSAEPAPDDDPEVIARRIKLAEMERKEAAAKREIREEMLAQKELVPIEYLERMLEGSSAIVIPAIESLWQELAPITDGIPSSQRKALRKAFEEGIDKTRSAIAREADQMYARIVGEMK